MATMYLVRPTAKIMKALSESDILSAFFQRSPQREQFVSKQFHGSGGESGVLETRGPPWEGCLELKHGALQRIHGQVCTCKNNDLTNKTVC